MWKKLIVLIKEKMNFEYRKNYGFIKSKFKRIKINSAEVTLDNILNRKASIARFGDGELDLIYGKSLKFQDYHPELAFKLKNVIKNSKDDFLVCIPYTLNDTTVLNDEGSKWWEENLYNNRLKWLKILKTSNIYYDAFISRFYMEVRDKKRSSEIIDRWRKVWDKKEIVIVEGRYTRLGVGNDLFNNAISIERVVCPQKNAFDKYNEIVDFFYKNDLKNKLLLVALGPTATVLSYDLYLLGYQVIDIGHIDVEYEWYLANATEKIAIPNKYVNEVNNSIDSIKKIENHDYLEEREIICII